MLYSTLLLAVSAFSNSAVAQNSTGNTTPCCSVDASTVNSTDRATWCQAERNTCPEICGGPSKVAAGGNTCDDNTLAYKCECANGTKPNMSDYQQSVPGQMCLRWYANCIAAVPNDLTGQEACKEVKCGNKTTEAQTSSASSSVGPSATGGGSNTQASNTASSTPSPSATGAAAVAFAREYGTPLLTVGILAAFGLAL